MRVLTILLTVLVAGLPAAGAPATPSSRDVVVRGGKDLADLLARATSSAWKEGSAARPVAIVVDVTPHTAAAKDRLVSSFVALGERITHLSGDWRIGALGRRLSDSVPSAGSPNGPGRSDVARGGNLLDRGLAFPGPPGLSYM